LGSTPLGLILVGCMAVVPSTCGQNLDLRPVVVSAPVTRLPSRAPLVIGLLWGVVGAVVGGTVEREAGVYGPLSVLLRIGREGFADVAAAKVSQEAALERLIATVLYQERYYSGSPYVLPAPPGLEEIVKRCGRQGGDGEACFSASIGVPEHGLAAAGAHAAEYLGRLRGVSRASLRFSYVRDSRGDYISLSLRLYCGPGEEDAALDLRLFVRVLGGGIPGIDAGGLLVQVDDLIAAAGALKTGAGVLLPPLAGLVVRLSRESRGEWGEAAAGTAAWLATTLLSVTGAALHEVQRASRIQAAGLEYSAIAEAAEEARSRALEAYSGIAEEAASGQVLSLLDLMRIIIWSTHERRVSVWEVLDSVADPGKVGEYIRSARAEAKEDLNKAIWMTTGMRAAAEILASLSEPE